MCASDPALELQAHIFDPGFRGYSLNPVHERAMAR